MLQPSPDNKNIHEWTDKETINIFFNIDRESNYVIFLIECILSKMPYVEKAETGYYLRLNNFSKDI